MKLWCGFNWWSASGCTITRHHFENINQWPVNVLLMYNMCLLSNTWSVAWFVQAQVNCWLLPDVDHSRLPTGFSPFTHFACWRTGCHYLQIRPASDLLMVGSCCIRRALASRKIACEQCELLKNESDWWVYLKQTAGYKTFSSQCFVSG